MADAWEKRKKALEDQYFHNKDLEKLNHRREEAKEELICELCQNRCPKCGDRLEKMIFREVPLDRCVACGGVWLGPRDLQILAEKDHRTWFERWFREEEERQAE